MKGPSKTIWVTMILKTRDELRFKVRPQEGRFKWPKNGTEEYLVRQERASIYRGKPSLKYRQGDAEPQDPYGGAVLITAEELNEIGSNNYVRQAYSAFKNNLATNLQWVVLVCLGVAVMVSFYFGNETVDKVDQLQAQLYMAHPPPAPAPTPTPRGG